MIISMVPSTVMLLMHIFLQSPLVLSLIFLAIPIFVLYFFRDPHRAVSRGIVSPADGRVLSITENSISIFMGVGNVHVNRSPVTGILVETRHFPGTHRPAFHDLSSSNERQRYVIETGHGRVVMTQVAGIFARRIVPYVEDGDHLLKGQRIGMIRFGSRVDIELPSGATPAVAEGDLVRAGTTTVGEWR